MITPPTLPAEILSLFQSKAGSPISEFTSTLTQLSYFKFSISLSLIELCECNEIEYPIRLTSLYSLYYLFHPFSFPTSLTSSIFKSNEKAINISPPKFVPKEIHPFQSYFVWILKNGLEEEKKLVALLLDETREKEKETLGQKTSSELILQLNDVDITEAECISLAKTLQSQIDYQNDWFDKFDEKQERNYGYGRTWLKGHQRKTRQRLSPLNRNTPVSSELLALVSKSKDTPLSPEEEQVLIKDLKSLQADQLLNVVLPSSIPEIIECNPEIAVALFVVTDKFNELELYFSPLLSSPALTLNSLNVVNKLTTNIPISSDLVHRFVNRCISLCEVYSERGDVDRRDRWVRLVCLFIQSLIRNRVIYLEDYIIELQSFCLGNSRIKEAAALYRVVTGGSSGITGN